MALILRAPAKILRQQKICGKRVSKCFLGKATVWLWPLANLEMVHCSRHFLTERGFHRARSTGVNENSLSKLKLFQNAPCGDVVEITRLELVTYTLRTYRATNCAISPCNLPPCGG